MVMKLDKMKTFTGSTTTPTLAISPYKILHPMGC